MKREDSDLALLERVGPSVRFHAISDLESHATSHAQVTQSHARGTFAAAHSWTTEECR